MKRVLLTLTTGLLLTALSCGQSSVDNLFSMYGGRPGYVTVSINGSIIKLASALDEEDADLQKLASKVTGIRILAREDESGDTEDFYSKVYPELQRSGYEEFMLITSSDSKVAFMAKGNGKKLTDMILLVGGDDSAIIQVTGSFTMDDAKNISSGVGKSSGIEALSKSGTGR